MSYAESGHYKWHSAQEAEAKRLLALPVAQVAIGYWRGKDQRSMELVFPMPIADSGIDRDIDRHKTLADIEQYATVIGFRGFSRCRICGCVNGSQEYIFQPLSNGAVYRWPKGLMHYFNAHKIAVPDELHELCDEYIQALSSGVQYINRPECPPLEMEI